MDLIYNAIEEMPTEVIESNIRIFTELLKHSRKKSFSELVNGNIKRWKEELSRRDK